MLLARRLVEAGVRLVTGPSLVGHPRRATNHARWLPPPLGQATPPSFKDLDQRGLTDDAMVIAWRIRTHSQSQ